MKGIVKNLPEEIPDREKLVVDEDTESDEEAESMLERAVLMYKKNKKEEKVATAPRTPKRITNETDEHQNPPHNNTDSCATEFLNGDGSVNSDMQDLIKYFIIPKQVQKNQQKVREKTLRDYEKQGAIPKRKIGRDASNDSKKFQAKVSDEKISLASGPKIREKNSLQPRFGDICLNDSKIKRKFGGLDCGNEYEETCSKPFFYIVPKKPCPNFAIPPGSYYVIPKAPNSAKNQVIIFHPESSTYDAKSSPNVKFDRKARIFGKSPKNMNNLGKDVLQRIDSHLNIGPAQIREEFIVYNLEARCNISKIFEKAILSPEKSSEAGDVAQETEETHKEGLKENEDLDVLDSEESNHSDRLELITEETDDRLKFANEEAAIAGSCLQGQVLDVLGTQHLDSKIQEQYALMMECLPESRPSDLLEKCIEFQGNEEKVVAYIEKTQRKTRNQQLVTDLQHIFPDAEPNFLLKEIENLSDDQSAVNILTDRLLDDQNYPRVSSNLCETRKKLWLAYVKNFDVKNYLLKVPTPENFAGAAGDHNKANENLIMAFLTSRYPNASLSYLKQKFSSNSQNVTKTCINLTEFQVVRLWESTFEHENFDEDFLKEICYIDHKVEIDNHLKAVTDMKEAEIMQARLDGAFLYCPLCSDEELIASEAVTCPEGDVFCKECIRRYVEVKVGEATYKFACPMEDCQAFFTIPTLEEFLPETISSVFIKKQQAEEISVAEVEGLEFCQRCDFAYIPNPEDKVFKCQNPNCLAETCRTCHEESHIPFRCEEVEREVDLEARKEIEEAMSTKLFRRCPQCQKKFVKIDGCNLMRCVCGANICYICTKIISGYDHFSFGTCPTTSNNKSLHVEEVFKEGIQVKNEILKKNPNIRIIHDPTKFQED